MKFVVLVLLVFVAAASAQLIVGDVAEGFANVTFFGCDSNGTVVWDPECQLCICYSGFFGCQCQYELSPSECNYVPFDPLVIAAATPFAIDQTETGFNDGNLTIVVYGAAIEKTATTGRVSFISVGKGSLSDLYQASLVFNATELLQILETPNPCRCFVKSAKIDANGNCDDVYVFEDPWTTIRDDCCKIVEDSIFELVYDCTLDVFHFDEVVLSQFPNEPTRGQSLDNPLPLFVKFQQSVNTTASNISVFADVEVQAYIADQSYDLTSNTGTIQIDIVTNWPYQLTITDLEQAETALFDFTFSLGPTPDSNTFGVVESRPCNAVTGSVCWQTLTIIVTPLTPCNLNTLSVVNLDNVFTSTYTVSCRTPSCPDTTTSTLSPVTIVATINTENFCPFVEFKFPLNGTLSAWSDQFAAPETNFIVYADPVGAGAKQMCIKGTADVDYQDATPAGQGNPGEAIIGTYFHKLYIFNPALGLSVMIYDDSLSPPLCTIPDCATTVIDTSSSYNHFGAIFGAQAATTAGACLFLTTDLLAPLDLNMAQSPVTLDIEAVLGVVYSGAKKDVQSQTQIFTVQSNIQAHPQGHSSTDTASASIFAFNALLVFASLLLCLFF